jgi:hypothetical protein
VWYVLAAPVVVAVLLAVFCTPFYLVAKRSGVEHPAIAFIPWFGAWIVLFETIRKSGWLALLVLVPYVGILIVCIWTAVEVPKRHGRSQWWTAALVIPIVNILGYWVYALTLEPPRQQVLFGGAPA